MANRPKLDLTRAQLDALPEYSASIPTGQTIGKRWRRNVGTHQQPIWAIGEYIPDDQPDMIGMRWYDPVILEEEVARLRALLNTPEFHDFGKAVVLEAMHQRLRWDAEQDAGKAPSDWYWLIGYLAGKALQAHMAGDTEKALHHTISSAAASANWHAAILGTTAMRPGLDAEQQQAIDGAALTPGGI